MEREDLIYETELFQEQELVDRFLAWFDDEIGTDREVNHMPDGTYVMCFDLTERDLEAVRIIENQLYEE